MRQAIETRFLGPTDHRGSRIKARADAGTLTLAWDDALDVEKNHQRAATALADKFGWLDRWQLIGGALPGPHPGYAFVLIQTTGAVLT